MSQPRWCRLACCGGVALALVATRAEAQLPPPLQLLPWLGADPRSPMDRGRGVVAFGHEPVSSDVVDSLAIRALPAPGAAVLGYFLQRSQPNTSPYALAVRAGLTANLVEFGYEVVGVPIDSIEPRGAWARVVYAFDAARQPAFGWVGLDSASARMVLWADFLPTQELFLVDSVPWVFSDRPLGSPIPIAAPPSPGDYALHPVTTRGAWLQVRVVVPSDVCQDSQPRARSVTGWLQYLDARGRPRVWFAPRGC
jgi:hypothetical protein